MMKRFLFAAALAALLASANFAAAQPVTTAPPPAAGTVIVGAPGAPVIDSAPAQPARRGLFGRLRNRNTTTYSPAPVMTAPAPVVPAPGPAPMPGVVPAPMPVRPGTSYYMPATSPNGTIMPASGILPAGAYTATDGTIITAGYTEMQSTQRRGLFGRLRNR